MASYVWYGAWISIFAFLLYNEIVIKAILLEKYEKYMCVENHNGKLCSHIAHNTNQMGYI